MGEISIRMKILITSFFIASSMVVSARSFKSLVPSTPSKAPDYFCTWNIQGYYNSYIDGGAKMRQEMNEENIFGCGPNQDWISFYPQIRHDLFFVMDDSWDVPRGNDQGRFMGLAELSEERFPSFKGHPAQRLKKLVKKVKAQGWKGLGGWICAQQAEYKKDMPEDEYWTERLIAAETAGFSYWKVDYGRRQNDTEWRRRLTNLGRQHAPHMKIEHAMNRECVEFSDVFRTYDVENIIAQPVTIQRVASLLPFKAEDALSGIINCEDEPYIAAGLGCAIGIMRHPYVGNLPDGRQDDVFPPVGHNYKRCLDEVVRAVRWHRLAMPFGVNNDALIDEELFEDYWEIRENETWNRQHPAGTVLRESAPARIARNMPLPEVNDSDATRPFILASTYPNGAVALAAIGRAQGREYIQREVPVAIQCRDIQAPIGLFGFFSEVTIIYPTPLPAGIRILAQDLAGDIPVDITNDIKITSNALIIPGSIIRRIGLMNATPGDLSAPGLVIKIIKER